ncbi:M15 family metallopeptidase [Kribbella sp. NPDC026611]|uniref:M15 family metallopeptidase n=1 Tax=Kribbella sp. NPDC026611 TaxID=3154911 RepID=UPI0033CD0D8E
MLTDHLTSERLLTALAGLAVVALTVSACTAAVSGQDQSTSSNTATKSGPLSAADGVLPDHTSAYDTNLPGVAKLGPDLRKAVQRAETAMKADGISMQVTSGWRSKKYQKELLDKAIRKYGSRKKALEYAADPDKSHHVTGHAVDIGPTAADDWLIRRGNRFGLCQTLSKERWHFELVTTPGAPCPAMS